MLHEDHLLRQIQRLAVALARRMQLSVSGAEVEVDAALRDVVGLDLRTIDALSPAALAAVLAGDDEAAVERRLALADALDALADAGPTGDGRRARALALRG